MLLGEGPAGGGHPHAGCPEPLEGETDLSGHERFGYVVTSAGLVLFAVRRPPAPPPPPDAAAGRLPLGPRGGKGAVAGARRAAGAGRRRALVRGSARSPGRASNPPPERLPARAPREGAT